MRPKKDLAVFVKCLYVVFVFFSRELHTEDNLNLASDNNICCPAILIFD